MKYLTQTVQKGDWKAEKHVPIIHLPKEVKAGEVFEVSVSVGDEIAHPNTVEHHIAWVKLFFQPEGSKFPIEVGSYQFAAHGEAEVFSAPLIQAKMTVAAKGTFTALSYCNLHGLWESAAELVF